MLQDIGRNLKRIRRERDLSQADVARLIGIRQQHLSDIENGRVPKLELVAKIARRLCVSPDDLLRDSAREISQRGNEVFCERLETKTAGQCHLLDRL